MNMGKLSDKKLTKLQALDDQGGFWYITKQNLVFRDLCFMAKILEDWDDRKEESYQTFFDNHKGRPEYGSLAPLTAHRATKNCEYIGLTLPSDKYSAKNLTPFYFALKKICGDDFNLLSSYPHIIDKQLERMFIDSRANKSYTINFQICPFMFLFKILLLIGDITKSYKISTAEFKLFVATAQSWNEYFEVVESILRYRNDKDFQTQCNKNNTKVSDVRYNVLAQNHSQLSVTSSEIAIADKEIRSIRRKVAEYELSEKVQSAEDIFSVGSLGNKTIQKVFYGAPGTGKSHEVKKQTGELLENGEEINLPHVFRTTFHPDTDYAAFVGCYKPTMRKTGKKHQVDGKDVDDEEIIYEFVPQVFTDAYVYACINKTEPTYLVIEEINRGNCAQIFGDLFQLLDRKNGISEYAIKADKDLAKHLMDVLGADSEGIKDGKLRLPANLHILATMNTSDQSLFPMDSAFKRRWEWEYVPINYGTDIKSGTFDITIGDKTYSWVDFIEKANKKIFDLTQSEDKQLGNFFIKGSIGEKEFKSKVMFYLWYEVLRDETENTKYFFYKKTTIDDKEELGKFIFKDLYEEDATQTLQQFMEYLGVAIKVLS
jgi:hypothetical protein